MVDRFGEQVALGALAAKLLEQIQLGLRFDSLGDYLQTQMMGEHHDYPDDFESLGVSVHAGDEDPVNLQSVDAETLQSAQ